MKFDKEYFKRFVIYRYEVIILIFIIFFIFNIANFSKEQKSFIDAKEHNLRVALTFDDGPHPYYTEKILEILNNYNTKATFFVVGKQVEKYPNLLKLIILNQHEVGNHTYNHVNLKYLSRSEIFQELQTLHNLVKQITSVDMKFFRPPGGEFNYKVLSAASSIGYSMILWTNLPRDHENSSASTIKNRIFDELDDGAVILLHSGVDSTIEILPKLIEELKSSGYRFLKISELVKDEKNLARLYSYYRY